MSDWRSRCQGFLEQTLAPRQLTPTRTEETNPFSSTPGPPQEVCPSSNHRSAIGIDFESWWCPVEEEDLCSEQLRLLPLLLRLWFVRTPKTRGQRRRQFVLTYFVRADTMSFDVMDVGLCMVPFSFPGSRDMCFTAHTCARCARSWDATCVLLEWYCLIAVGMSFGRA